MKLFKKLKAWLLECPDSPQVDLAEIFMLKGPSMTVSEQILRHGLPFHIRWAREEIRNDN